jgi:mandelate racemase
MDVARGLLQEPLRIVDGHVTAWDRPGIGLEWDAEAVARHRVSG